MAGASWLEEPHWCRFMDLMQELVEIRARPEDTWTMAGRCCEKVLWFRMRRGDGGEELVAVMGSFWLGQVEEGEGRQWIRWDETEVGDFVQVERNGPKTYITPGTTPRDEGGRTEMPTPEPTRRTEVPSEEALTFSPVEDGNACDETPSSTPITSGETPNEDGTGLEAPVWAWEHSTMTEAKSEETCRSPSLADEAGEATCPTMPTTQESSASDMGYPTAGALKTPHAVGEGNETTCPISPTSIESWTMTATCPATEDLETPGTPEPSTADMTARVGSRFVKAMLVFIQASEIKTIVSECWRMLGAAYRGEVRREESISCLMVCGFWVVIRGRPSLELFKQAATTVMTGFRPLPVAEEDLNAALDDERSHVVLENEHLEAWRWTLHL